MSRGLWLLLGLFIAAACVVAVASGPTGAERRRLPGAGPALGPRSELIATAAPPLTRWSGIAPVRAASGQSERGKSHRAAVRALAFKRIRVPFRAAGRTAPLRRAGLLAPDAGFIRIAGSARPHRPHRIRYRWSYGKNFRRAHERQHYAPATALGVEKRDDSMHTRNIL